MFKVIKLKPIMIGVALVLVSMLLSVGIMAVANIENKNIPKPQYTIVIDAGHGGRDDGCSGRSGIKESGINLMIAKTLKSYLETLDINIVMTRSDGNGLYSANAKNYKQSDMENRIKIIDEAAPNMVISIHQNSFSDSAQRGAQAFFQEGDEKSRILAENVQKQLLDQLPEARVESNDGDYYLLKESGVPAIIVECGYLTNEEDERLLGTEEYRNQVAYAVMCGVIRYLGVQGN